MQFLFQFTGAYTLLTSFANTYKIGEEAGDRPYLPSFVLPEMGKENLNSAPRPTSNIGITIGNGRLPGSSNGGKVLLGGKEWGSDFVAIAGDANKAYLIPTDKDAVKVDNPDANVGLIVEPGVAVITFDEMAIIAGLVTSDAYLASKFESDGARVARLTTGLFVIQHQLFERGVIQDVSSEGITTITRL